MNEFLGGASGNARDGFRFSESSGNALSDNVAEDNDGIGFLLFRSSDDLVKKNAACGNGVVDAAQGESGGNRFVRNEFCTTLDIEPEDP